MDRIYGCLPKESTPILVTGCHPELDGTPLLGIDDQHKFQILLGILQWMVTIGKPELCQAVSFLNHFGAFPREGHLDLVFRYFGYMETTINNKIIIDSRPIQFNRTAPNFQKKILDFIKDYLNALEDMDPTFPYVFGLLLQTVFLIDAYHTHDLKTRRSFTGLIGYVGSTQVVFFTNTKAV